MKPTGPIQWSLNFAQTEFDVHRDTLKTRLTQQGEVPDAEGFYTTKQILKALFTDAKAERIRLTREQADKVSLDNAQTRREQAPMLQVEKVWTGWAIGIRDAVRDQEITQEQKQNILAAVRDIDPEEYFKEEDPDAAETE